MGVDDLRQFLTKKKPFACNFFHKPVFQNHVQHSIADSHGQRIAPIGGAMSAGGHGIANFIAC